jgi:hypothetical protein
LTRVADELARGRVVRVVVETGSMAPTLAPGDAVLVERRPPRLGDVVLIDTHPGPTLHRLVARLPGRWVHAGDASSEVGLARDQDVIGVADTPSRPPGLAKQISSLWAALVRRAMMRS